MIVVCVQVAEDSSVELFKSSVDDTTKVDELQAVMLKIEAVKEDFEAKGETDEASAAMELQLRELIP